MSHQPALVSLSNLRLIVGPLYRCLDLSVLFYMGNLAYRLRSVGTTYETGSPPAGGVKLANALLSPGPSAPQENSENVIRPSLAIIDNSCLADGRNSNLHSL